MKTRALGIHDAIFNEAPSAHIDVTPEVKSFRPTYRDYELASSTGSFPAKVDLSGNAKKRMHYLYRAYIIANTLNGLSETIGKQLLDGSRRCVYCNNSESYQVDHFLPKEKWPQYAIYLSNLIPSCGRCNHLKSDQEFALHPTRFSPRKMYHLDAKIVWIGQNPSIRYLIRGERESDPLFDEIISFFKLIDYQNRFGAGAMEAVSSMLDRIEAGTILSMICDARDTALQDLTALSDHLHSLSPSALILRHLSECSVCLWSIVSNKEPILKCKRDFERFIPVKKA